jgi:hypothetical protein
MRINYKIVADAISFYKTKGYQIIDVPWVVPERALSVTAPSGFSYNSRKYLVASGEQSFIHLLQNEKMDVGKFCCATPCYRPFDSNNDVLHFHEFFKVELISVKKNEIPAASELADMIEHAKEFMESVRKQTLCVIEEKDDPREGCETLDSWDITTESGTEMGSYGIRKAEDIGYWIYGTGAALPRLEYGL